MIEEMAADLFRVEIPLPGSPLKYLNSYVIRGGGRNLIIDTGLNRPLCLQAMRDCLHFLGIDLKHTDFYITHLHADHLGLLDKLAVQGSSRVFFNHREADLFGGDFGVGEMLRHSVRAGFPEVEIAAIDFTPSTIYGSEVRPDFCLVQEDDRIRCGGYDFRCIETPGHTKGHICLYEEQKGILISGDHILNDISPIIQLWSDDENPLADYLASLQKVAALDVDLVLPGHRTTFTDCKRRIEELRQHHHNRIAEVLDIVHDDSLQSAYQVAAQMNWNLEFTSWEELPVAQRWFATGEANAHLKYVQEQGEVRRREINGKFFFYSAD